MLCFVLSPYQTVWQLLVDRAPCWGTPDPFWTSVWGISTDAQCCQDSNDFSMPWGRTRLLSALGNSRFKSFSASGDEENKRQVFQGWQWQAWVLNLLMYTKSLAELSTESYNHSFQLCFPTTLKLGPKPGSVIPPGHCSPGCSISKGSASFLFFSLFCWKAHFWLPHGNEYYSLH